MDGSRPLLILFAGVNGVGKSTFFKSKIWHTSDIPERFSRVNPDEIAVRLKRDRAYRDASDSEIALLAGKEAYARTQELLCARKSFNRETTLTGRGILRDIRDAQAKGYEVRLFYIGLPNPQIAVDRIERRVGVGGHGIDEKTVFRRYDESLANLGTAIDFCDDVCVFDNTEEFKQIGAWKYGVLAWMGMSELRGKWLSDLLLQDGWHKRW